MDASEASALAEKMIVFLETGALPGGLFRADMFGDFTLPHWRLQTEGLDEAVRLRRSEHSGPSVVTNWRADPTPNGFVLEFEERWEEGSREWYSREMMRADVVDGEIAELAVYCSGDWDEARQAAHAREVTLVRPGGDQRQRPRQG
jgi:hypothetical protein